MKLAFTICALLFIKIISAQDSLKICLLDKSGKPIENMVNLYLSTSDTTYNTTSFKGKAAFVTPINDTVILTARNMTHTFFTDTVAIKADTSLTKTIDLDFTIVLDEIEILDESPNILETYCPGCQYNVFYKEIRFESSILGGIQMPNGAPPTYTNFLRTRDSILVIE